MRMFRLWCMALCLVFAGASFASAHRVNIFAFVDGDAVQVECGFNRSQKVKQGTVEVFDATTGVLLLQGTTDDNGVFRFPVTAELREAGHDLNLRIIAGEGHQNDWTVAADELASSGTPKAVAVAAAEVPATSASLVAGQAAPSAAAPVAAVSGGATPAEIERIERRRQRRIERKTQRGEAQAAAAPEPPKPREVETGSKVRMAGQDMVGVVQSVKGKKVQVAFGQILTTVDKKLLTVVSNSEFREATRPQTARTVVSVDISARKLNFRDHIDVRGMRAAEALDAVQDFVDDALMVGVGAVSILHGKGTGALKEEIRRYLRTVPEVESAKDEHADRGGAGITIVTFKMD